MSNAYQDAVARGKRIIVRQIEMNVRLEHLRSPKRPDHVPLSASPGHINPDSGRRELQPPRGLIEIGRYFRQARMRSGRSQEQIARQTGVSQSMVSRFERGVAPGMRLEKLVSLALALERLFPFGTCPHEHDCAWQPIRPPQHVVTAAEALIASILDPSQDSERSNVMSPPPEPTFIDISLADIQSPSVTDQSDQ